MEFIAKKSWLLICVGVLGIINVLFIKAQNELIMKILGYMILFTILLPIFIKVFAFVITPAKPTQKRNNEITSNDFIVSAPRFNSQKKEEIQSQTKPKHKSKKVDNPLHNDLKNLIAACSKNKLLSREDILQVKIKIDDILGQHRYAYSKFNFENDIHEIYVKIKSSKLQDKDYNYLLDYVSNLTNKGE